MESSLLTTAVVFSWQRGIGMCRASGAPGQARADCKNENEGWTETTIRKVDSQIEDALPGKLFVVRRILLAVRATDSWNRRQRRSA